MKAVDLKQQTIEELNARLLELLKEQFNLRMQKATGQLSQNHLLGKARKDIARIKTILGQKAGE